jgi:AraC-like DNA-binding protein
MTPLLDIQWLPDRARAEVDPAGRALTIVVARGAGTSMACHEGTTLVVPLRGGVRVSTRAHDIVVRPGAGLVPDRAAEIRASTKGALWIAVTGNDKAWRAAMGHLIGVSERCAPLPGLQPAERAVRRALVGLLRRRNLASHLATAAGMDEDGFLMAIARMSRGHLAMIERCPGRTLNQRTKVYIRLQNARVVMLAQCEGPVSIERLAALSGYSAAHFMRTFHAAFGETVYGFLTRARLAHARALLARSELAVAEVAIASGFDDRGTFSRQFRRHFGITAIAWRRRHARLHGQGVAARQRDRLRTSFGTLPDKQWHRRAFMHA